MTRFSDGVDGLFTASTAKDASTVAPTSQPYPSALPAPATPISHDAIARSDLAPPATKAASAPVSRSPERVATSTAGAAKSDMTWGTGKVPLPSAPPAERLASAADGMPKPRAVGTAAAKVASAATVGKPTVAAKPEAAAVAQSHVGPSATYTVASGDTLSKIARKTGVPVAQLKAANDLGEGGLKIGQKLALAKSGTAVASAKVANAATAAKPAAHSQVAAAKAALDPMPTASAVPQSQPAAYTPPQSTQKVVQDAESASTEDAPEETGVGKMRWPVRGRVVARYGGKGSQASDGIDIAVPEGTPVKAAENGVVIYAGDGLKEFGNTVLVRHDDGLVTVYGNASQLKVTRGEKVTRGQEIALSGMSGSADTPKLHFEVRKNSAPVDPSGYLQ